MDNFPRDQITNLYQTNADYLKTQKRLRNPELMRVEPQVKREEQPEDGKKKKKSLALLQKRNPVKLSNDEL